MDTKQKIIWVLVGIIVVLVVAIRVAGHLIVIEQTY